MINKIEERNEYIKEFVSEINILSPEEIFYKLEEEGYYGQINPRKALSLMAYRHIKRLKQIYIEGKDRKELPPKQNYLLIGPTGCGKTFLIEQLFQKIIKIPAVILDVTNYSETGYVGQDVCTMLTRLVKVSSDNKYIASIGIICLDEFDKLASGNNNAVFSGAGTTKDVTGIGVQRELLKLIDSGEVEYSLELSHSSYFARDIMKTDDISFIACGAFSGFKGININKNTVGFNGKKEKKFIENIAVDYNIEEVENIKNFLNYGFLPELIARFNRIIPFHSLNRETLKTIMYNNTIKQYKHEFSNEGYELIIKDEVIDYILDKTIKQETGARGLHIIIGKYLEDLAFNTFGKEFDNKEIKFNMDVIKKVESKWE